MRMEEKDVKWGGAAAKWVRRNLKFTPDAEQAGVLDSPARRIVVNCTLGWGKTTLAAAKAVYEAQFRTRRTIAIVHPTPRQTREFMQTAEAFAARVDAGVKAGAWSLELKNGSRIVGVRTSAAALRKLDDISMLIIDDAARVNDQVYKTALRLLAASGGVLWLLSTPYGKRGFFYKIFQSQDREWRRVFVPAAACPRISAAFLKEKERSMFPRWFRQEYRCEFAELEEAVFDPEVIRNAFRDDVKSLIFD